MMEAAGFMADQAKTTTNEDFKTQAVDSKADAPEKVEKPAAAAETEKESGSEAVELKETEVKQAFLKRFRKKKKLENEPEPEALKVKPEAVKEAAETEAGEEVAVGEAKPAPVSTQELAERLYRDIAKTQRKEYFVVRIKKRTLLFGAGVMVILLWLLPVVRLVLQGRLTTPLSPPLSGQGQVETEAPSPTIAVEVDGRIADRSIVIRIRDNAEEGSAAQMQSYLLSKGYENVELIDDHGSQYSGIGIVVKPNDLALRQELESILSERYLVSSPSAELTEDSQVDGLILYGE